MGLFARKQLRLDVPLETGEFGLGRVEALNLDVPEIPERIHETVKCGGEREHDGGPQQQSERESLRGHQNWK